MGSTHGGDPRGPRFRTRAGLDRLGSPDTGLTQPHALGTLADQSAPQPSDGWRADDAEQRRPIRDQRKIDREFAPAGDELLGAVERVDQKEAAAIGRLALMRALFR